MVGSIAVHWPVRKVVPVVLNGFDEGADAPATVASVVPFQTLGSYKRIDPVTSDAAKANKAFAEVITMFDVVISQYFTSALL
jgi:hypothetical protein